MSSSLSAPRTRIILTFLLGIACLLLLTVVSLAVGSRMMSLPHAWQGFWTHNHSSDSLVVWKLRLPRTLAALLVGMALATAGVLMQALTRNPLAEPGLLGINSGASLAVVTGITTLGTAAPLHQMWLALAGAMVATTIVFLLGIPRSSTRFNHISQLLLAGVALNACLSALTGIITMFNSQAFDSYRFWVVGAFEGRPLEVSLTALPFMGVGILLALLVIRPLEALALGDDAATALGAPVTLVRVGTLAAIALLCGSATAVAGPISFIGLMIPHFLRLLVGIRLSAILPLSLVFGPLLMLTADIIGRVIAIPSEIEAGIVTAFIGAPLLLTLIMRFNSAPARPRRKAQNITQTGGEIV